MDLVICSTPLQILQIKKLIDKEIINKFEFFCFSEPSEQIKYYFEMLKVTSCKNAIFYEPKKRFPFYVYYLKKIFKGKKYGNVYFANIDNIYCQYILSFVSFDKIITIDDGTLNLYYDGSFYKEKRSNTNKLIYNIFGCKYNLRDVKKNIYKHYSIFKNKQNIAKNIDNIDLFNATEKIKNKKEINVLLGTVYSHISDNSIELLNKLECFFKCVDFIYIPHPRDSMFKFDNAKNIDGLNIAEDKIIKLLKEYETINLYGFNSSAQINLSGVSGIRNYVFKSKLINFNYNFNFACNYIDLDVI
ncbi:TPA: glycosyltransferase family 52 [Photobacterium damselae]